MPSAFAGLVRAESGGATGADAAVDALAPAGLPEAGRAPGLRAYGDGRIEHGAGAVRVIDGRVEQATADVAFGRVVLRRDAVGVRPLYYACSADRLVLAWASRLPQLGALAWVDRRPDWTHLFDLLGGSGAFDPARTSVTGIRQVPPGHRLEWAPGRLSVIGEWDPEDYLWDGGRGPGRPADEFAARLVDAVLRRGDASTGVLLSGGLDSPSVAAAAVRAGLRPRTLSSVFPDFPSVDESALIRATQDALGLAGALVVLEERALDLDGELLTLGEPHIAPNYCHWDALMQEAAHRGYGALLDGHDGDTALGRPVSLGPLVVTRPGLGLACLRASRAAGATRRQVLWGWAKECAPEPARRLYRAVRPRPAPAIGWVSPELLGRGGPGRRDWLSAQLAAARPKLARALVMVDLVAARHGVDVHHPYADRELLEFLLGLPPEAKHLGGRYKGLVREGFPELPPQVRYRTAKTLFDEAVETRHPLSALAPLLLDAPAPVPGVDYDALQARLASGVPYAPGEFALMRRLALVHRFLAREASTTATP